MTEEYAEKMGWLDEIYTDDSGYTDEDLEELFLIWKNERLEEGE